MDVLSSPWNDAKCDENLHRPNIAVYLQINMTLDFSIFRILFKFAFMPLPILFKSEVSSSELAVNYKVHINHLGSCRKASVVGLGCG